MSGVAGGGGGMSGAGVRGSGEAGAGAINRIFEDEALRLAEFPVAAEKIFLAHAGVTALPRRVAEAVIRYAEAASRDQQEFGDVLERIEEARRLAAGLIGARAEEIALLGPTSLGLSLFANGIEWAPGDEVVCYFDDYPANVYPWLELRRRGVAVRFLEPGAPGEITPEVVERALGPRTRLVALASCHYLTGWRLPVEEIGALLRERGVLFSLDAIQTLGAFPTRVDYVDMLSADAHKWLLGPLAAGIVYVRRELFGTVRPTLVGAWNGRAPEFVAQAEVVFPESGRRYEPGVLNVAGILGMSEAIRLLEEAGIERVAERILALKAALVGRLREMGFRAHGPAEGGRASGITSVWREDVQGSAAERVFRGLTARGVACSLRRDRSGRAYLRFSPHFYNTEEEIERAAEILRGLLP